MRGRDRERERDRQRNRLSPKDKAPTDGTASLGGEELQGLSVRGRRELISESRSCRLVGPHPAMSTIEQTDAYRVLGSSRCESHSANKDQQSCQLDILLQTNKRSHMEGNSTVHIAFPCLFFNRDNFQQR